MADAMKTIEEKLSQGRSYRNMQLRAEGSAEDEYIVEGYATTFNEKYLLYRWSDYEVYEEIDPHAFDECDMSDVIMQYDHEGRVFARLSNKTMELKIDKHGLHVRADLSGTQIGRQLHEEIKGGYTSKMSFGFSVKEDKREIVEDKETGKITVYRTITKISKLYDVSAVSLPANDGTEISARSYGEGVIAELIKEFEAAEKKKAERAQQIKRIKILCEV